MISTRNLSGLPNPQVLQRVLQSRAMLDAILEPDWEMRYFSFNSRWAPGQQMGSMRNGQGDDLFVLFSEVGCFLRGFDHQSDLSPYRNSPPSVHPGVLDAVPEVFRFCLEEPAFHLQDTTFCLWWSARDPGWNCGPIDFPPGEDPDGSGWILSPLDGSPKSYLKFAEDYYERKVSKKWVQAVYDHQPLTQEILRGLKSSRTLDDLQEEIQEIGYPTAV